MPRNRTFKGAPKPMGKSGHFNESNRHSLQAKGIKTGNLAHVDRLTKLKYLSRIGIFKEEFLNRATEAEINEFTAAALEVKIPEFKIKLPPEELDRLNEVGDEINTVLNDKHEDVEWTPELVREIANERYGEEEMSKYSDTQLWEAQAQYEHN